MNKFDKAQGLYWFCSDYYHGQDDPLYSIVCKLKYKPVLSENRPKTTDAWEVYKDLISNKLDPEKLLKEVQD